MAEIQHQLDPKSWYETIEIESQSTNESKHSSFNSTWNYKLPLHNLDRFNYKAPDATSYPKRANKTAY